MRAHRLEYRPADPAGRGKRFDWIGLVGGFVLTVLAGVGLILMILLFWAATFGLHGK